MATRDESARRAARAGRAAAAARSARTCTPGARRPSGPRTCAATPTRTTFPPTCCDRQLTRADGRRSSERSASRPTTYRAGRNGFDGRTLADPGAARATRWTPAWTRCSTSAARAGTAFAGAPLAPYHPDYGDVRAAGRRRGSWRSRSPRPRCPRCPRRWSGSTPRCPPIPYRGALQAPGAARRCGCARPTRRCRTCWPSPRGWPRGACPASTSSSTRASCCPAAAPTRRTQASVDALPRRPAPPARAPHRPPGRGGPHVRGVRRGLVLARAGPAMNVLMVTPHLPPHQAANALLPAPARRGPARARPRASRFLTFGDGARRATASPTCGGAARRLRATRLPQALEAAETWWKGGAARARGATWCTSTPAPG